MPRTVTNSQSDNIETSCYTNLVAVYLEQKQYEESIDRWSKRSKTGSGAFDGHLMATAVAG